MFHSSEFLLDPAPSVAEHLDPRRVFATTDRKINPGPPAQRFMKPPLSRYIALAQRRTNGAYVASRAIIGKKSLPWRNRESSIELLLCETPGLRTDTDQWL